MEKQFSLSLVWKVTSLSWQSAWQAEEASVKPAESSDLPTNAQLWAKLKGNAPEEVPPSVSRTVFSLAACRVLLKRLLLQRVSGLGQEPRDG